MIVRATVTRNGYEKGVEYTLLEAEARAMVIRGEAVFVAVAPANNREKAISKPYEKRKNGV